MRPGRCLLFVRGTACRAAVAAVACALAVRASHPSAQELWHVSEERVQLADLLDVCVSSFGFSLDYDREAVRAEVTVRSGPGVTPEAFWRMTNRLLAEHEFACVQAAGEDGLAIVALAEAASVARVETGAIDEARAGYVKVLHTLTHAKADEVGDVLRHVLAGEGSLIQSIPTARQVLLAGLKPQVAEALAVAKRIDLARARVVVEEVVVLHLPPPVLVGILERVGQAMAKVSGVPMRGTVLSAPGSDAVLIVAPMDEVAYWRETIEEFDRVPPVTTREYSPTRFGLDETAGLIEDVVGGGADRATWRLVRDSLTGTILLTAAQFQHDEVARLLERLESTPLDAHRAVRSFPVRYRDVDQVLELLEGLIGEGSIPTLGEAPETPENELPPATPGGTRGTGGPATPRIAAKEVHISKDTGTNRLLAIGPPRLLDELGRLIESLDVQQPQVLVEALIVTLSEGQSRDVAVELQKLTGVGGSLGRVASLFGAGSAPAGAGALPPASGIGLEAAVLDPGGFSGVLRALEAVNDGRALTIPKVLVNNHETANLDSVLQTPYASTNASNTVATTSFGGTLDAGTTISVTPQITDGDQLLIDYTISLSSFTGAASDNLPPPRQENRLASIATVPDGYTVVVGGLEIEQAGDSESRVPILGSLPLIGHLFKSQSSSTSKSRFFVFLRCSVLRNTRFADLRHLSRRAMSRADVPPDFAGVAGVPEVLPQVIR